ncbi:MAG: magnesium/cobalt transporter CorA [Candidatus Zixiibacteriota bacterium]
MIVTHVYQPDRGVVRREGLEAFDELLKATDQIFWVDFYNPSNEESYVLTADFGFHPLAIEDVISESPGPKVDDYKNYLFVVFKIADYVSGSEEGLVTRDVDLFLMRNGVVTVHYDAVPPLEAVARRCMTEERIISRGADFFFHAVLDYLVDYYNVTLERMEDDVDQVEDEVFEDPNEDLVKRVFNLKRDLSQLKRIVTPLREMLNRFSRDVFPQIGPQAQVYFRDVFDHMQRINELADSFRDTLNSVLEVYFSTVQNQANETIKLLTIISTILLPLTFLTGVYGMNFKHFPMLQWEHGLTFFWALIVVISIGMIVFFKRKKLL